MRLFIAEKHSLAQSIVKQLDGRPAKEKGFYRVGDDVVTYLSGHVLEQSPPEAYAEPNKTWQLSDLPVVPTTWKIRINDDKAPTFRVVERLVRQATSIVHAGDPDREGQLIVDEVLEYCGYRGAAQRLWQQGEDAVNMRRALSALIDNRDKRLLSLSSLMRQRADWIVGFGFSIAFKIVARNAGYRRSFSLGRVIMPTLRLVVDRDRLIENFVPIDFFGVSAELAHPRGAFAVDWQPKKGASGADEAGRCTQRAIADKLAAGATGAMATVETYTSEPKTEKAPLPFDLGSLSAKAGQRFKLKPKRVLQIVQSLYEKKLVTYPRTESRYLPAAQFDEAPAVFAAIAANSPEHAKLLTAATVTKKGRVWDDSKTKSHHAIIPTMERRATTDLTDEERKVYDLIVRGYIAQFYPEHTFQRTVIEVALAGEKFATSGRVPLVQGWRDVLGSGSANPDERELALPQLNVGDRLKCAMATVQAKKTEPPARYTQNTLQTDMINAHKFITDERMRALLKSEDDGKHPGIGTPATQPDIIERLCRLGYVDEDAKGALISTPFGRMLIDVLPRAVTDVGLTALFEMHLGQIATGETTPERFTEVLVKFVTTNVQAIGQCKVPPPSPQIPAFLDNKPPAGRGASGRGRRTGGAKGGAKRGARSKKGAAA